MDQAIQMEALTIFRPLAHTLVANSTPVLNAIQIADISTCAANTVEIIRPKQHINLATQTPTQTPTLDRRQQGQIRTWYRKEDKNDYRILSRTFQSLFHTT